MVRYFFLVIVLCVCFSVDGMSPEEFVRQSGLGDYMKSSEKYVKGLYKGRGSVIYGRIIAEPSVLKKVVSRIHVNSDGYFVNEVYRGRTVCFYLHGFKPIRIPITDQSPLFLYAGNLKFTKLPADKCFSVTGKVELEKQLRKEPVTVTLWMGMPPQVLWDDGHCGHVYEKIATQTIKNGKGFQFDGLSPVKYSVDIKSGNSMLKQVFFDDTGLVGECEFPVNSAKKHLKMVKLPTVKLLNAPTIRCSLLPGRVEGVKYNHVPDNNTVPPVFSERVRTFERVCNGKTSIPIAKRATYYKKKFNMWRNFRLFFKINKDNQIVPSFGFGCSYYYDFGKTTLDEAKKQIDSAFMQKSRYPKVYSYRVGSEVVAVKVDDFKSDIVLEDGHVYYFEYPGGNVYFLLKTEFLPSVKDSK